MRSIVNMSLAVGLAFIASAAPALAQFPDRAVRMIIPFPPGGAADFLGRLVADKLKDRWGQSIVIENLGGAGSNLGVAALARADADGYTIGMINVASHAINPSLYKEKLPFDPVRGFEPVTLIAITPNVLVVNPAKVPVDSLPAFIAYLKANPGKVTFGSSGVGGTLHVGMELLQQATGTKMVHVPYRGSGPMMVDLLAGQIDSALDGAATAWPNVVAGRLRALAVSTPQRAFFAPDLPALNETFPGLEVTAWHGLAAPAGTPRAIVEKISADVRAVLDMPEVQERFKQQTVVPSGMSPDAFKTFIATEQARWAPVVESSGAKVE